MKKIIYIIMLSASTIAVSNGFDDETIKYKKTCNTTQGLVTCKVIGLSNEFEIIIRKRLDTKESPVGGDFTVFPMKTNYSVDYNKDYNCLRLENYEKSPSKILFISLNKLDIVESMYECK